MGPRWLELAWGSFAAVNLAAIVLAPSGETVPFHFIWVSFALLYGARLWRPRSALLALLGVCISTGIALGWALIESPAGFDEMAEVPLMGAMFVAMMWHVYRRQAAMEQVRRLAESERRLLESQQEMVRDASHQLRTPITVARGHAELIRTAYAGQVAAEDAGVIVDELNRLSRIAERLLLLAASEHPGFLRPAPLDLESFLKATERRWSATAKRRWSVSAPLRGVLLADEERLAYTLDALLENAVKFSREGDLILLTARAEDDVAVIEVTDTGIGIPNEHLGRIFDRFARTHSGNGGTNGTGLGLAIVKAIVEAHGGSVSVISDVGKRTTFSLRLPGFSENGTGSSTPGSHDHPAPTGPEEHPILARPSPSTG